MNELEHYKDLIIYRLNRMREEAERIKDVDEARNLLYSLYTFDELYRKYGVRAVWTALQREKNLRERKNRKGGRPSIIEEYKREIDRAIESYKGGWRDASWVRSEIQEILEWVRRRYSKATYFKIKKYAKEKLSELE